MQDLSQAVETAQRVGDEDVGEIVLRVRGGEDFVDDVEVREGGENAGCDVDGGEGVDVGLVLVVGVGLGLFWWWGLG